MVKTKGSEHRAALAGIEAEIRRQVREGREDLDVPAILAASPWGRRQTERRFRERFLTSPQRYFRDLQAERARGLLARGSTVLAASLDAGFTGAGRMHEAVVRRYGLSPGELRRRGAGVRLSCGFFHTQVGVVLIGRTSRGLATLRLCGAEPTSEHLGNMLHALQTELSEADVVEEPEAAKDIADHLVAFLDARTAAFCPSLDVLRGTAFQREVWAALQRLRTGETVSYGELARRIRRPTAVRAVARACGANGIAIAIPCHRVVGRDGSLTGYRWGVEWKRRLLELEREMTEEGNESHPGDE
jgi:AraC family transcriptional regulator of adaptative response/methylated-DNA-[protein]-cysteine methyltransferase